MIEKLQLSIVNLLGKIAILESRLYRDDTGEISRDPPTKRLKTR